VLTQAGRGVSLERGWGMLMTRGLTRMLWEEHHNVNSDTGRERQYVYLGQHYGTEHHCCKQAINIYQGLSDEMAKALNVSGRTSFEMKRGQYFGKVESGSSFIIKGTILWKGVGDDQRRMVHGGSEGSSTILLQPAILF
jgi:hypothetical protein